MRAFAEDALVRSLRLGAEDREAFKGLYAQLYNRQPDGTLTTWMMLRKGLEARWDRATPFADVLASAKSARLLREDELRIEGGEPCRYIRLGHDALAKVAAAWQAEREEKRRLEQERDKRRKQFRRMLVGAVATGCLALLSTLGVLFVVGQNRKLGEANESLAKATREADRAADHARASELSMKDEASRAQAAEKVARDKVEEAQDVLWFVQDKILAAARPEGQDGGLGTEVTLRKALEAALPQVEPTFRGRPLVEAEVRMTMGSSFFLLGDAAKAARQFQISRDLYTGGLGPDHTDTLASMTRPC